MVYSEESFLAHHGIKGQKWGVRRFQNPDGTRTTLGKRRERENNSGDASSKKLRSKTVAKVAAGIGATGAAVGTGLAMNKASKNIDRKKLFDQSISGGKDKPKISPAEKFVKEGGNVVSNAGKIYRTAQKARNLKNGRESKRLSDQELHERINRLNLEKQYEQLVEEDYSRGHITADDVLNTVGSIVTIGGSIATMIAVAAMVKK